MPVYAYTEDDSFYIQVISQPVKLKNSSFLWEEDAEPLISPEGMVSPKLMDSVHDDLSGGYRVVDMDVHPNRIVLLLDTTDCFLIRIAQWNEEGQTYVIADLPGMPNVILDTYHDGESVFFECFSESFSDNEPTVLVTLEELDGLWHVTRFTDAMTYSAEKTETGYIFCDYWDCESEEYQYHFFSPTQLSEVTWVHIIQMVDEYNLLFPLRPALEETYCDEANE